MTRARDCIFSLLCVIGASASGAYGQLEYVVPGPASNLCVVKLPPYVTPADMRHCSEPVRTRLIHDAQKQVHLNMQGGDSRKVDAVILFADADGKPLFPDRENRARVQQRPASTALSFTYDSPDHPWTPEEISVLSHYFDDFYPIALQVCGEPAFIITVNVRKDTTISAAGYYYPYLNEMVVSDTGAGDVICHEMIHAFRDDDIVFLRNYEEGMTRAAELEVFHRLPGYSHWDAHHSYVYDVYYEGLNTASMTPYQGDVYTGNPLLNYQLAGYAWGKCLLENADFLKQFNQEYYTRLLSDPTLQYTGAALRDLVCDIQSVVEGDPTSVWYDRQHILNYDLHQGYFLCPRYSYAGSLYLMYFYRNASGAQLINDATPVNWRAYDYNTQPGDQGSSPVGSFVVPDLGPLYVGSMKFLATMESPEGTLVDSSWWRVERGTPLDGTGIFGVVKEFASGSLTVTPLDGQAAAADCQVTDGAFCLPSLENVRGRFGFTFLSPDNVEIVGSFNKDAAP